MAQAPVRTASWTANTPAPPPALRSRPPHRRSAPARTVATPVTPASAPLRFQGTSAGFAVGLAASRARTRRGWTGCRYSRSPHHQRLRCSRPGRPPRPRQRGRTLATGKGGGENLTDQAFTHLRLSLILIPAARRYEHLAGAGCRTQCIAHRRGRRRHRNRRIALPSSADHLAINTRVVIRKRAVEDPTLGNDPTGSCFRVVGH